jgi:ATP-dependent helicase HrpA
MIREKVTWYLKGLPKALRTQLGEAAQLSFAQADPGLERRGLKSWDFGDLPETLTTVKAGQRITGYPALADEGDSVAVTLLDTREAADASTRQGVVRLVRIALREQLSRFEGTGRSAGPPGFAQAALQLKTAIPTERLQADILAAICDRAFVGDDPLPRSERAFAEQVRRARTRLPAVADAAYRLLTEIAAEHHALTQRINALPSALSRLGAEARVRRDALVGPGFFQRTPWAQLGHLPRYLKGLDRRLAKYPENPARDARHAETVADWWRRYHERVDRNRQAGRTEPELDAFRWLLEELQISLFAQELRTPFPVSYKRLQKAWSDLSS